MSLLLQLAEWAVAKYGHDLFVVIRDWVLAKIEKREDDKKNKQEKLALKKDQESGDIDAIKKAAQASSNGTDSN